MKKYLHLSFCFTVTAMLTFLCMSCEYDADGENYHHVEPLPSEISVAINLAEVNPEETIYIYGPTSLYYQVSSEKAKLYSVEFRYDGKTVKQEEFFNPFHIIPAISDAGQIKNLEMTVTLNVNDGSLAGTLGGYLYTATAEFKIKYVRITPDDFDVKSQELDRIVLYMTNKKSDPCKYVINGKEITDLDNIIYKRDHFPGWYKVKLHLLPEHAATEDYNYYNYIEIEFGDKRLGDFHVGSSVNHFMDTAHEELYVWSMSKLFVHDKNMNILSHKEIETHNIAVTPVTGLVVCAYFGNFTTYADKSLSKVVSTMSNMFSNFIVTERDQLIQSHNFQVDVYDLHTGKLVYTIKLSDPVHSSSVSADGKYLFIKGSSKNYVYLLNDDSASVVYSFTKYSRGCRFHPVNKYHVIFDNTYDGFEIFDIETRQIVYSNKGEFQSIDPITGNLLFYDENYSYQTNNYENRFIDTSYNEIYVFSDDSKSLYGEYKLFNNYMIKHTYYINLSSKLTKL